MLLRHAVGFRWSDWDEWVRRTLIKLLQTCTNHGEQAAQAEIATWLRDLTPIGSHQLLANLIAQGRYRKVP